MKHLKIKTTCCAILMGLLSSQAMALDTISGKNGDTCPQGLNGLQLPCGFLKKLPSINTKGDNMPCSLLKMAENIPALSNNPAFMVVGTVQKYMPTRYIISSVVMR